MVGDRNRNPSRYAVVLVSEGARFAGEDNMSFLGGEADQYGHKKLGGIGDKVAEALKQLSPKYNNGRRINVVNQRLGYMVRSGNPDALDSIVPMAYGTLALELVMQGISGRLVCVRNGVYDNVPIDVIIGTKKVVDTDMYYNRDRLRPQYDAFEKSPVFLMSGSL
jgi:6-phosphofructokinase 1